ncbi:hypothetical protein [Burkholderia aenigmatica]|uniref:Uncharacterized protein n=1 Tax=Burkholderia aenigmatica TaxID=2015348 RepID=A0A228IBD9_9BURK|nr:hypothetical protein [Burkholderia aenigmatica]OXI39485.1 hypothetical protein CFB84_26700 [Burkholderia aenigmatica]
MLKHYKEIVPVGCLLWLLTPAVLSFPMIFVNASASAFYYGRPGEYFELPEESVILYSLAAFILYYGAGYRLFVRRGWKPGQIGLQTYFVLAVLSAWTWRDYRALAEVGIVYVNQVLTIGDGVERSTFMSGIGSTSEGYSVNYAALRSPRQGRRLTFGRFGGWNNDYHQKCFREYTGLLGLKWANTLRDCPEGAPDDVFSVLRLTDVGPKEFEELKSRWRSLRTIANPTPRSFVSERIAYWLVDVRYDATFVENGRFVVFEASGRLWVLDKKSPVVSYVLAPDMSCLGAGYCNWQGVIDERNTLYLCSTYLSEGMPNFCRYVRLTSQDEAVLSGRTGETLTSRYVPGHSAPKTLRQIVGATEL